MYTTNNYPESWKHSYIHLISKSDGCSLRPIALTTCVCKLFETLIKNRLQWWAENNNLFPKNQNIFRKGKSRSNNLTELTLLIKESFRDKAEILARKKAARLFFK